MEPDLVIIVHEPEPTEPAPIDDMAETWRETIDCELGGEG